MKNLKEYFRKGRNVKDGYDRGWGLEFGDIKMKILEDPLYQKALKLAEGRTIVSENNRMNIFLILRDYLKNIQFGHIVEFGAYKGGNVIFMAYIVSQLYPGVKVFAFDTFEGMPETDKSIDAHKKGDFSDVNLNEIIEYTQMCGLKNIEFIKGLFENTVPISLPQIGSIALAHIDCDIYTSVAYSYDSIKKYMVPGGYIIFDDGLYSSCLGATEAIEELVIRRDGLHCEQIFPHFVFRAPNRW